MCDKIVNIVGAVASTERGDFMLKAEVVAKWFIFKNPELSSGYIDENTKLNKLLYFSNLMYSCVNDDNMIEDEFIAFPNGPVVFSIYRDYRYNNLSMLPHEEPLISDPEYIKILEIVNFVYGNMSTNELVEESHSHSLWQNVKKLIPNNPKIVFSELDENLISYYKALYDTYADVDFSKIVKEKINDNIYYYDIDSFKMTDEIVEKLSSFEKYNEPKFLDIVDGELVIS